MCDARLCRAELLADCWHPGCTSDPLLPSRDPHHETQGPGVLSIRDDSSDSIGPGGAAVDTGSAPARGHRVVTNDPDIGLVTRECRGPATKPGIAGISTEHKVAHVVLVWPGWACCCAPGARKRAGHRGSCGHRRSRITEVLHDIAAHVIADPLVVPHRPGQQVLHPIRVGVAGVLGDRPAVLSWQVSQQPAHERPGPPPQVSPGEPARDPPHQLLEQLLPASGVKLYAVACGHRLMFGSHTTTSSTVAALVCSPRPTAPDQPGHDLRLED
jgi:hypothetical protein